MDVVPAILTKSKDDLTQTVDSLKKYFPVFQIDIADGKFVPNKTLSLKKTLKLVSNRYPGLIFDFHLMVKDYNKALNLLGDFADKINIRYALIHTKAILSQGNNVLDGKIGVGLVINPDEELKTIMKTIEVKKYPVIQIMSVMPGFQGSPFIQKSLNKIEHLRTAYYRSKIFLDGGINLKTLPIILSKENKPNTVCIGSYLTKSKNIQASINYLNALFI